MMKDFCQVYHFLKSLQVAMTSSVLVLLPLLCLLTSPGSGQICNTSGWLTFEKNQYLLVDGPNFRTYSDAINYCRSLGGDLAVITSNEQNAFLNTFTLKHGDFNYWIGLNDLDGDGIYTWINRTTMSGYSNLRAVSQRPAGPGECIRLRAKHDGQWDEANCTDLRRHICQRPKG
nr:perlucin-like protein [Lytechinus pictus]